MRWPWRGARDKRPVDPENLRWILDVVDEQTELITTLQKQLRKAASDALLARTETHALMTLVGPMLGNLALLTAREGDAAAAVDQLMAVSLEWAKRLEGEESEIMAKHRRKLLAVVGGHARAWLP